MPDLDSVLRSIERLAAGPIARAAPVLDRERSFPRENVRALAEAGAYGLTVPRDLGGAGGGLSALAQASKSLGSSCASTALVFLMHSVTAATIAAGGGARGEQLSKAMADGNALGTLAFSERGTGAHFYSPELQARPADGALRVSGKKSFVTSGGHADVYLVLVQSDEPGAADAYALEADRRGVSFEGTWDGLGMTANSSIAMRLSDVELTRADRIGEPGGGLDLVFEVVAPYFLVGLAAVNAGIAAAAANAATAHAPGRRYPDGTSLAHVQFIQHLLADIDLRARSAWLLISEAARLGEAGDQGALVPIMEAKIAATEAAVEVTHLALEVTGGRGYTPSLPIERHLRDARAGSVMAPTNAVLRSWIGKALAGLPVP